MQKLAATTAAAILLTTGLATPAWAVGPPSPTNVQLTWVDDQIRVTWQDQGEANIVRAYAGGEERVLGTPAVGEPNEVLVSPVGFRAERSAQFTVVAVDAEGKESGKPGVSRFFDTLRPGKPELRSARMRPDLSVELIWYEGSIDDINPGDPLDRADKMWVKATVSGPAAGQQQDHPMPRDGSDVFIVPAPPQLSTTTISAGNEWGTSPQTGPRVRVGIVRVDASVKATKVYGVVAVPEVKVHRFLCACAEDINPEISLGVDLQARPNSSAPWKTVKQNAGPPNTPISMTDGLVGSRQYRIWVPEDSWYSTRNRQYELMRPLSTAPKTSLTLSNFVKTGFVPSTAPVSATVKLNVEARPLVDKLAALQRWDGKQWRYVRDIKLIHGAASIPIRAAGRGTTTKYRILVPRIIYRGLPIELSTSKPFTLTVR